jgi:hypothetical protein
MNGRPVGKLDQATGARIRSCAMNGHPLEFLLLVFAGWVKRRQLAVIDYLKEENRSACGHSR